MRILIGDLPVIFPYTLVFNEQVEYMNYLNSTLNSTGHAILEMPTGTGKTISLLALLTSYLAHRDKYTKVAIQDISADLLHPYCCRDGQDSQRVEESAQKEEEGRT